MRLAVGGDHAGFEYKTKLLLELSEQGHTVKDFGPYSDDPVDYPDFVHPVAEAVERGDYELAIMICGSANGVAMTANKHQKIRAAICWNNDLAALARPKPTHSQVLIQKLVHRKKGADPYLVVVQRILARAAADNSTLAVFTRHEHIARPHFDVERIWR